MLSPGKAVQESYLGQVKAKLKRDIRKTKRRRFSNRDLRKDPDVGKRTKGMFSQLEESGGART